MKQSLQLSMTHQLTLTPQLQQAIRLLQLSTLDLQQEIDQFVESNPMLEISNEEEKEGVGAEVIKDNFEEISDFQWSQLYLSSKNTSYEDSEYNHENFHSTTTNLRDHLVWQLNLTPMSDVDRAIATTIIDAIDDNGFLTVPTRELHAHLMSEIPSIGIKEVEAVRYRLQFFDPIGCASENLVETLLIQLEQLSQDSSEITLAKKIIQNDITLLGQHNYRQLMKIYRVNQDTLERALEVIQRLHPKPGSLIQSGITEYVVPDVIVKKIGNKWQSFLNPYTLPRLNINRYYASLVQRADNSADNQFLKSSLQEARWFLKSIQSRQETLLKVAQCMVEHQQEFFEHGEEAMKPLVLNDVAKALEMHESTISRVTTQKYMHTPKGLFELKYFFSSHVSTDSGGECSSIAIRAVIKKLIGAENRIKPLSDSKISQLIGQQGVQVARRTVAKYREAMGIAPSNERKTIHSS